MADFNNDVIGGQGQTNHGTTEVAGIIGTARHGDGTQWIEQLGIFSTNGTFTMNFWLKTTDTNIVYPMICGADWNGSNGEFQIRLNNGALGAGIIDWQYAPGQVSGGTFDSTILRDGNWHMITLTKADDNISSVKLYIDAAEATLIKHGGSVSVSLTTAFTLLARSGSYNLVADIDEFATWSVELDQDKINLLYNGGIGLPFSEYGNVPVPPVVYYDITIADGIGGDTTPISGTYTYSAGEIVSITGIVDTGFFFDYWNLDGSNIGSTNPVLVTMNANHILVPVYAPIPNDTGGIITHDGLYTLHTFLSDGVYGCNTAKDVEMLIVAGGGGGGRHAAGGGGAGGLIHENVHPILIGTYPVIIGNGGLGAITENTYGIKGDDSLFNSLIAIGGGAGAPYNSAPGGNGGSGGGGAHSVGLGGLGTLTQGNNGGAGGGISFGTGGGGGGAFSAGANGESTGGPSERGGKGGDGLMFNISGSNTYYAGGGGGSSDGGGSSLGGLGGGGIGGDRNYTPGGNGIINTGGGGGGGGYTGIAGNGGSGIIIIKYLT